MLDPVASAYLELYPREAARTLARLEEEQIVELIGSLSAELAAAALEHLGLASSRACLQQLPDDTVAAIIERMPTAPAAERLRGIERARVQRLLGRLPRMTAVRLRVRLRHSEGAVGSLVDTDVVTLSADLKVGDALKLARSGHDRLMHQLYVLDEKRRLKGVVDLCDLLAERDRAPLSRVIQPVQFLLHARASLRSVEGHPGWEALDHLPVIDREGVFQGILERTQLRDEEHGPHSDLADRRDLAITQGALADVFWLAMAPLFGGDTPRHQPGEDG